MNVFEETAKLNAAIGLAHAYAKEASERPYKTVTVRYVLRDKSGEFIVRQIKASGKELVATVRPDGSVERHDLGKAA